MLLRVEHVNKHYGGVHVLNDVSFTMDAGTVLAVAGDNGAGKSTLVKCITGSEMPDSGKIAFNEHIFALSDPYTSRSAGIEMIYQNLDLCPEHDAVTNIFLGREPCLKFFGFPTPVLALAEMRRKANFIIANLNVDIAMRKKVGLLSGGQQQAVAIARALLYQPKLLIMDEPTAALGIKETTRVNDLIRSLKKQGLAIILISHRLGDIFEVADRVALMRHGKIVKDVPVHETSLPELTKEILCQ